MMRRDSSCSIEKAFLLQQGLKLVIFLFLFSSVLISCNNDNSTTHGTSSNELSEITIGSQVWSAHNLDVATFRNGDFISEARSKEEWEKAGKERKAVWCYYENSTEKGKTYGRLYNWYAVNDPRGLCPQGWHVPTNDEWIVLENYLSVADAGMRLKCNKGWTGNGNGDNSSHFCLLPGGYRDRDGRFDGVGEFTYLTGLTESKEEVSKDNKVFIWGRGVQFENKGIMRCGLDKEYGLYLRCIKNKI